MITDIVWVHFTLCDHYSEVESKELMAESWVVKDMTEAPGGVSLPYWCQACAEGKIGDTIGAGYFKYLSLLCWQGPSTDFSHLKLSTHEACLIEDAINGSVHLRGETASHISITRMLNGFLVAVTPKHSLKQVHILI